MDITYLEVLKGYTLGIFPMGNQFDELEWYCPPKRCVFFLDQFHYHKRLERKIRQGIFDIKINQNFKLTMQMCANRDDIWISAKILNIYTKLHELGFAHSVEAYYENNLVGGLYGVSIGGAFMGESMFHTMTDASKVCLVYLVKRLQQKEFMILDCQYQTNHLSSFGAKVISHEDYLEILAKALMLKPKFV